MKLLTPANISTFVIFALGGALNYFGTNPRILYLPALAVCLWILYQTHAYVSHREAAQTPEPKAMNEERPNIKITSHNQKSGFTGINTGTVNLGPSRRGIDPSQESAMLSFLASAPKGRVSISVTESDQEAVAFARDIESDLKKSGYQVDVGLMMMMSGPMGAPVGLGLTVKDANAVPPHAQAIGDAMAKIGLNPSLSANPERDADVLYITVGANPLPK